MSEPNAPQQGLLDDLRQSTNLFLFLCRALAFPVELGVIRFGTWGPRYLDLAALLGFFWPLLFLGLAGPYPANEMRAVILFWWGSIGFLLAHRVVGLRRRAQGYRCHSQYWGTSRFVQPSDPPGSDRSDAREWAVVSGAALLIAAAMSRPLGVLLLISSFALLVTRRATRQAVAARLREMEDLRIENQFYFERFRDRTDHE